MQKFVKARIYHSFSVGHTILTTDIVPTDIIVDRIEAA